MVFELCQTLNQSTHKSLNLCLTNRALSFTRQYSSSQTHPANCNDISGWELASALCIIHSTEEYLLKSCLDPRLKFRCGSLSLALSLSLCLSLSLSPYIYIYIYVYSTYAHRHTITYHAKPCHAIPCNTMPYHTRPDQTIPHHAIACHSVARHIISYHIWQKHGLVNGWFRNDVAAKQNEHANMWVSDIRNTTYVCRPLYCTTSEQTEALQHAVLLSHLRKKNRWKIVAPLTFVRTAALGIAA